ncbi:DUF6090 family protein [Robiginitalea marina]|uniref:DUF6090 family protein n=1 Tax=Robiginitalea marina TaxID=2954105 RepID=A0ABT1B1E3_9FLAO|nr:DUF6090 family protein [Robiginitalea marina]MCO5726077.1 DUF6090 family protein [Robiginitalea marina]
MLRFFRTIRQRLLSNNKFSSYLLYAIGEILLVVIGILIALQVNNWNEGRLERKEEVEVLKSVKKDLANTIKEFQYLNQIRDKVLYGTRGLFQAAGTDGVKGQELDSLIGLTFYRPTFNNKQGAITLLFTSGKINLIQNDSIRELLLSWPGLIDDMVEEEVFAVKLFQDSYYPALSKYVFLDGIIVTAMSTSFFGTITPEKRYSTLPIETDYNGLLADRDFLNHLRMRATHMQITKGETHDMILHANGIIALIDEEIGR